MKKSLLLIEDVEQGSQKVTLNLDALFPDEEQRQRCETLCMTCAAILDRGGKEGVSERRQIWMAK